MLLMHNFLVFNALLNIFHISHTAVNESGDEFLLKRTQTRFVYF